MFAGLREGDAIRITRAAYDGRDIATRTRKAGTQVWWPCPSPPKAILDESLKTLSDAVTLAVSSRGTPWTESGLRASWRKIRIGLEERGEVAPGLTLHGLRRTVATTMRELGYDDQTIADALGQKTAGMAAHYSKRADLKRKMTGVVRRLDAAENKRRKASVKTTD
jgi:integrase